MGWKASTGPFLIRTIISPNMLRSRNYMRGLRVLLYHNVSADGRRDDLTVSSSQLEEQFQYLQQAGYTSIAFSDLIAYCDHSKPLPPKPVLVTFDDGFRNNATIAYPLAKKYGIKIN